MRPKRGTCRGCGHPVLFAQSEDEGVLMLEVHEGPGGKDRYTIVDGTAKPVLRRDVHAHHRHVCPRG